MYSLDCDYFTKDFTTIDALINYVMESGMDPSYEITKNGKPTAIIANTIKGKGVSFMEDDNNWHYKIPNEEEVKKSNIELGIN